MKLSEQVHDEDRKLTFIEKLILPSGSFTGTFQFQMIQMFLLYYYTDIFKISAGYVAVLFLVARVIDAFLAPAFGMYVDKVNLPWGKYRPWFLIIGIPTGVFGFLTFTAFDLSAEGKLVYATITYFFYSVFIAIAQGPGAAMIPAMTKRLDDRMAVGIYSYVYVMLGAMIPTIGGLALIKVLGQGDDARGFSMFMAILAVVVIVQSIVSFIVLKEKYVIPKKPEEQQYGFKEMLMKAVMKNRTAIIALTFIFSLNLANGVRSAVMIHYLKYFFHNEGLIMLVGAVTLLPTLLGAVLSPMVTRRTGLRQNLIISTVVNILTSALVIFIPATELGFQVYLGLGILGALFNGISMPAQGTLMPAAMDYAEWKTGINANAFMGSLQGFMQTFATAVSGALAAGALALVGYQGGAAEQTSGAILGIQIIMTLFPAIITVLSLCVIWFDLTEDKQKQIAHDLAERRKQAEIAASNGDAAASANNALYN
ncbi:putative membrane protein [Propionispora sp. 2/2-37]|uniref:MFS transporter n=1 Tax=Propionispora sp. 2/2-37 TaxID=1677858 RepID=UPI0006BB5EE4|nr:glycoside-pentoside-hexuronide (GPH):cation symporter [Propionispora sp. 2/2-37]CUH97048.1 putative membrane protein [Propionispora sp. 2/2-37]